MACGLGHERVVELLLQRGDLNYVARDAHGRTPLYAAVQGTMRGLFEAIHLDEDCLRALKWADVFGRSYC